MTRAEAISIVNEAFSESIRLYGSAKQSFIAEWIAEQVRNEEREKNE